LKNILIFDTSSPVVFLGYRTQKEEFFMAEKFEKKELNTKLPEFLIPLADKISDIIPARIIIGIGPGSFTGIKTGLALFLSMLYAKGINEVETISSSRFLKMLYPDLSGKCVTAIPFNKGQYFISLFNNSGKTVIDDFFTSNPFGEIDKFKEFQDADPLNLVMPLTENDDLINFFSKKIELRQFCGTPVFRPDIFEKMDESKTVVFNTEPLILNFVNLPANIPEDTNIYINNNPEADMTVEKISIDEINMKLKQLKEEHAKFDEISDAMSSKSFFTPQEEMELKTIRKKKLQKKDMINYYENLLKENS